jgi:hypothetical protein
MKHFALLAVLASAVANAGTLNCLVKDEARRNAGLPLHSVITDLSNQNTTFIRRSLDANGQVVEKHSELISSDKVSAIAPTERQTCTLDSIFRENTRRGAFTFTCGVVLLQFAYDLNTGWANYYEKLGSISKTLSLRHCAFTP